MMESCWISSISNIFPAKAAKEPRLQATSVGCDPVPKPSRLRGRLETLKTLMALKWSKPMESPRTIYI
jgi:hypothetical protein